MISSRARPPLVKGAGCIGPLFPDFRGWPLWFMASIALWGPQNLAPEVVPVASLHSEALSPECGREHQETGDCVPTRHVGAGLLGQLGLTAHGLLGRRPSGPLPQPHGWVRLGFEVSRFLHFCRGAWHVLGFLGVWSLGLFSSVFFSTSINKKKSRATRGGSMWSVALGILLRGT